MHFRGLTIALFLLAALAAVVPGSAPLTAAQQSSAAAGAVTVADYQRAEKFLVYNVRPLVFHEVRATWLSGDRFWYRDTGPDGTQFVMYDAAHGTRQPAFDHAKIAAALSTAGGKTYDAGHLPFMSFEFSPDEKAISFSLRGQAWKCDLQAYSCAAEAKKDENEAKLAPGVKSPDGKSEAFIRDWNLWVRDVASGKETQLTTDGVKDFGYATDNAGWIHSDSPIVLWSPDSKKIATFQQDQRNVGEMYLVETKVGHPKLEAWKYPLPGDDVVTMIQRVIIDVNGPKIIRLQIPPDQHRSTLCDDLACRGGDWADVEWSADSTHLAFRLDLARPQARTAARCRCRDRRGPRRPRRNRGDAVRIGPGACQLALPAGIERGDLVFGARRVGPPVSLRPRNRQAEESNYGGRIRRDAGLEG